MLWLFHNHLIACSSSSKTIVHAGTKFTSGEATKALESMLGKDKRSSSSSDTEGSCLSDVTNKDSVPSDSDLLQTVTNKDKPNSKKAKPVKETGEPVQQTEAQSKKRSLQDVETQSSQPEKKKKANQSKSCRRKLLPQVKGQQSLTKFFRV